MSFRMFSYFCQLIFTESDLIENPKCNGVFIELHPSKIAQLKENYVIFDEELKVEKLQDSLVFAFPLLMFRNNKEDFYLPLFIVDLPEKFLITSPFTGFSIAANNPDSVKVNISVLTNYFDVDADQIDENRNLIEMVSLICETPFEDFKSMYFGFIQWAKDRLDAKESLESKKHNSQKIIFQPNPDGLIYPLQSNDFNTNRDLEDFKHILSEIQTHGEQLVAQKYPLLDHYLNKIGDSQSVVKKHPVDRVKTYGLFESKYSLGRGQYQAIQAANITPFLPLIAVQGAPGTGKTTLFKSLIAQQITARAIAIIEDKDQSLNMLVCSTAIKAVDNVIADLKGEKFTQDLEWLWFHGGAKYKIDLEIQERLEPHIMRLKASDFNESEYLALKRQILASKAQIDAIAERYSKAFTDDCIAMINLPFTNWDYDCSTIALASRLSQYISSIDTKLDDQFKAQPYDEQLLKENILLLKQQSEGLLTKVKNMAKAKAHVKGLYAYWPKKFTTSQFSDWMLNKKVRGSFSGGVSKSMLKKSRLNFDKIEKCK